MPSGAAVSRSSPQAFSFMTIQQRLPGRFDPARGTSGAASPQPLFGSPERRAAKRFCVPPLRLMRTWRNGNTRRRPAVNACLCWFEPSRSLQLPGGSSPRHEPVESVENKLPCQVRQSILSITGNLLTAAGKAKRKRNEVED